MSCNNNKCLFAKTFPNIPISDREWWLRAQHQLFGQDPALLEARWRRLHHKQTLYRSIAWFMMPNLEGWTYSVDCIEPSEWWPKSMVMQCIACRHMEGQTAPRALMERTFIVISPQTLVGSIFMCKDDEPQDLKSGVITCLFDDPGRL
eukprot:COSAG04_NODE_659_length_11458_cov_3.404173_10_plen_148_part_00